MCIEGTKGVSTVKAEGETFEVGEVKDLTSKLINKALVHDENLDKKEKDRKNREKRKKEKKRIEEQKKRIEEQKKRNFTIKDLPTDEISTKLLDAQDNYNFTMGEKNNIPGKILPLTNTKLEETVTENNYKPDLVSNYLRPKKYKKEKGVSAMVNGKIQ